MTFVNFSNHPSKLWSQPQLSAAEKWGEIQDVSFPQVPASFSEEEIQTLAGQSVEEIMKWSPAVVMCQGEFTLSYAVTNLLKEKGIPVVAACSERRVMERIREDGTSEKTAVFEFQRFRRF